MAMREKCHVIERAMPEVNLQVGEYLIRSIRPHRHTYTEKENIYSEGNSFIILALTSRSELRCRLC